MHSSIWTRDNGICKSDVKGGINLCCEFEHGIYIYSYAYLTCFCNQGDYTWNHAWTEVSCIFFNIYLCTMYIQMYTLHSKIIVALGFSRVKICEVWQILKVQFKRTENVNASAPKYWTKRQIGLWSPKTARDKCLVVGNYCPDSGPCSLSARCPKV